MTAGASCDAERADGDVLVVVVSDGSRLHWPITVSAANSPKNAKATFAHPEVRTCFAPHFGQASALVLISFPHSLHFVIATTKPLSFSDEWDPSKRV